MNEDEYILVSDGIKYFNYFKDRFGTTEFTYEEYYDIYIDALIKCSIAYSKKPNKFKEKYNFQYVMVGYYRGYLDAYRKNKKRIFRAKLESLEKYLEYNYEE